MSETLQDEELSQAILALGRRFIQRWDVYARQLDDGRYICVHEPLNSELLASHLRGDLTLGTYVLDQDSRARYVVLDDDQDDGGERLAELAREVQDSVGAQGYLEGSRRGGHLWYFFDQPVRATEARKFGHNLLCWHKVSGVELFPKQDELGDGPGSLIRLPFGRHRVDGRRYSFVDLSGEPLAPTIRGQIARLADPAFVPQRGWEFYRSLEMVEVEPIQVQERIVDAATVSEKIKAKVTVLEFVSEYLDLKPTASGALGLCPFHDDHHPSFGINDRENFWNCFAGCGGGSVIDFWAKYRDVDFATAVKELAEMVL